MPTPVTSNWTKRLKNLVQNAGVDRGSVGVDNELESHSSGEVKSDDTSRDKVIINDEALFIKLKNNVKARSKLSTIHSARSTNTVMFILGQNLGIKSAIIFQKIYRAKRTDENSGRG